MIQTKSEIKDKTHDVSEKRNDIPVFHDVTINLVDDDLIDERTPCVYGPPSWYEENGRFNRANPEVNQFLNEVEEINKRNRQRKELRDRLQNSINEPIEVVYGPDPKTK